MPYRIEPEASGEVPVAGSIDFDWCVEVRLVAFDGRSLAENSIRFEPVE